MASMNGFPSNRGGHPIEGESPATRPAPVTGEEGGYPTRRVKSGELLLGSASLIHGRVYYYYHPTVGLLPRINYYSVGDDTMVPPTHLY